MYLHCDYCIINVDNDCAELLIRVIIAIIISNIISIIMTVQQNSLKTILFEDGIVL